MTNSPRPRNAFPATTEVRPLPVLRPPEVPTGRGNNSPVIPEKRKPLTRAQRLRMHDEHGSKCVICLEPIPAGEPFIDEHVIPLALGGSNDKSNRGPAHVGCAKIKTQRDQRMIAKAKRQRMKHLGIKKPSSFPCSKASPVAEEGFRRSRAALMSR
jgi:5-methylcytosine-specific restriction protein A